MGILRIDTKKEPLWIRYGKYRIKHNKNFILGTYGETGSGKSWSDLSMAEMWNPDYKDHPERICFSPLQLIQLVNSGELNRGDVIMMEEVGVQAGNRDWQSKFNKAILQLMQTFRRMGFILLINVPYEDFIDVGIRKLMHASFTTKKIDNVNKKVIMNPQLVQYNSRMKKFYYKHLRFLSDKGAVVPLKRWGIPKPSDELIKVYEKKRDEYQSKLNLKLEQEIRAMEDREDKKHKKKPLTEDQQNVYDLLLQGKTVEEIARIRDRGVDSVKKHMILIRKKRYTWGK